MRMAVEPSAGGFGRFRDQWLIKAVLTSQRSTDFQSVRAYDASRDGRIGNPSYP